MENHNSQSYIILLSIILLCIATIAPSANRKVRIKSQHQRSQTDRTMIDSVKKVHVDTLNLYTGHIVLSEVNLYASTSLQIDSIKVIQGGDLRATSETSIEIPSGLEVELGGEIQLNGSGQYYISFTYNNAGFRTLRKHETNP